MTATMTKRQYHAKMARLSGQLESARMVVATFKATFKENLVTYPLHDSISDAWNQAHDMVTAIEAEIAQTESEWGWRNVDPNTRALVQANID